MLRICRGHGARVEQGSCDPKNRQSSLLFLSNYQQNSKDEENPQCQLPCSARAHCPIFSVIRKLRGIILTKISGIIAHTSTPLHLLIVGALLYIGFQCLCIYIYIYMFGGEERFIFLDLGYVARKPLPAQGEQQNLLLHCTCLCEVLHN